jgi:hypothetical protein
MFAWKAYAVALAEPVHPEKPTPAPAATDPAATDPAANTV